MKQKADAYEAELEWQDISIEAENQEEKITLNRYALTPNGPKIDATVEEKKGSDSVYEEDGYTKLDYMRIVAWDDLGNYYLMYGRSKTIILMIQRFHIIRGSLFMMAAMVHWMDRKTGITKTVGMKMHQQ